MACPVCKNYAKHGSTLGDRTRVECDDCGTYEISGTALTLLKNGTIERPDPKRFRVLVEAKTRDSGEYPRITHQELEELLAPFPGWRVVEPPPGNWTREPEDSWSREPED